MNGPYQKICKPSKHAEAGLAKSIMEIDRCVIAESFVDMSTLEEAMHSELCTYIVSKATTSKLKLYYSISQKAFTVWLP